MYTVYALVDPRNEEVRYVGISENIYIRFAQHIRGDGSNTAKDVWIQELRDASVMLVMKSLEYVEDFEEARTREQHWIKHFVKQHARLLNQQDLTIFTYDDFMTFFKTEDESKKVDESKPRGEKVKAEKATIAKVRRQLEKTPTLSPTELSKKCSISRSYASELKAKIVAEMQAVNE